MNYEEFIKLMTMTPGDEDDIEYDSSHSWEEGEKDALHFVSNKQAENY